MKDDRLQLRVDAASKRRLEEAANQAHLSVTAFVLQAAAFAEALDRPAQVNERLTAALQRPAKFTWLD